MKVLLFGAPLLAFMLVAGITSKGAHAEHSGMAPRPLRMHEQASPTTTASPTPVTIDGRVCSSGRLVNGFLILNNYPAGGRVDPDPGCVVTVTSSEPPLLYGLDLPVEKYRLQAAGPDRGAGSFRVTYVVAAGPGAGTPAIELTLNQVFGSPDPLKVIDASLVAVASYFPHAGVALAGLPHQLQGCWLESRGRYCLAIDTDFSELTLEQAAGLLKTITGSGDEVRPPVVGNSHRADPGSSRTSWTRVAISLFAGSTAISTGWLALRRR